MSVDSDVAASLALAAAATPKADSLFDLVAPSAIGDLIPSFSSGKNLLLWLIANPGHFLTLSKALPALVRDGSTYSEKLEEGLIPIERVVAAALDAASAGVPPAVTIMSELSEDQLVAELVNRALSVPHIRTFGVQGVSGIQINKAQAGKVLRSLFREVLPYILPLLLEKFR